MAKTVTISDDVEARRRTVGYPSLNATAEAFITQGLAANEPGDDHSAGYTDDQLRALIDEGDASGPLAPWDGAAVKAGVLRRYALGGRR